MQLLLPFMRQAAASRIGARWVNRYAAFLDALDFAFFVHHERRAIGDAEILDQNPVLLGNVAHVIAQNRVADVEFLFPVRECWREIGADGQDLGAIRLKLIDTRLVCVKFLGSAAGEGGDKERENNGLLAAEIG